MEQNKNFKKVRKFLSYKDDDDTVKCRWVVVQDETPFGIKFNFDDGGTYITIPWTRILKIKEPENNEKNRTD